MTVFLLILGVLSSYNVILKLSHKELVSTAVKFVSTPCEVSSSAIMRDKSNRKHTYQGINYATCHDLLHSFVIRL